MELSGDVQMILALDSILMAWSDPWRGGRVLGYRPAEVSFMGAVLRQVGVGLLLAAAVNAPVSAQWTASVRVEEPAGIRRTAFPSRLSMEVPEGRLEYVSQLRLMNGSTEVAAQGTAWSRWPDGSIRELDLDFNISIGPFEERVLELRYGTEVSGTVPRGRGLVAMEDDRGVALGSIRLNRIGSPLLASVAYREELIGQGRNGIVVVERSGIRRDSREIVWEPVQLLKSGPVAVLVRYQGRLIMSGGSNADITLDVEAPNSKSWLKITALISDPDGRVGDVAIETPLRMGAHPWTWDFATPNATYGAFRDPTGSAIFTRTVDETGAGSWRVMAGAAGGERPYEQSPPGIVEPSKMWAHFVGADEAIAFAVETRQGTPGRVTMWFTGTGQTSVGFRSAEPQSEHELTVYQHYVSTPLPIGAATSPASILNPLSVTVE